MKLEPRPVLRKEDVLAFEERHGVVLPADYRRWLLEVGNGADPLRRPTDPSAYGVSSLDEWCQPGSEDDFPPDLLSNPFRSDTEASPLPGAIRVCNAGCENYVLLVVTGEHRGEIWYDNRMSYPKGDGVYPVPGFGFREWVASVEADPVNHLLTNDPRVPSPKRGLLARILGR